MKIESVRANNRRRAFEVEFDARVLPMPYSALSPEPSKSDPLTDVYVDDELGREGFTWVLASGAEGTVHLDSVLEYNEDPAYMRELMLYKLTLEVLQRVEASPLSTREIIRRARTSPAQFYRLLDPTNTTKSVDKMLELLAALDCQVDFQVREKERRTPSLRASG